MNAKSLFNKYRNDPLWFLNQSYRALLDGRVIVCNADFCEVYLKKMLAHS
ncbi:MAG: hypothetical protein J0I90_08860 [Nitrosospira sp.]|nr:hypothetical protein [Nitrosospira sp.]